MISINDENPNTALLNDIKAIKAGPWSDVITLTDDTGKKLLTLNKYDNNFTYYIKILSQKCPYLYRPALNKPIKANYKKIVLYILLVSIIFAVYVSIIEKRISIPLFIASGIFPIIILAPFLFYTQEVMLKKDRLILRYLIKTREIQNNDIESIEYKYTTSRRGNRHYYSLLTTYQGEKIKIKFLGINDGILYLYLYSWIQENCQNLDDHAGNL